MYSRMSHVQGVAPNVGDAAFRAPGVTGVYTGVPSPPEVSDPTILHVRWYAPVDADGNPTTEAEWQYSFTNNSVDTGWKSLDASGILEGTGLTITVGNNEPTATTTWRLAGLNEGWNPSNSAENSFSGDGSNALALANVKDTSLSFSHDSTTNVQSFYQGVIGDMAVRTNEAERMTRNTETLRDSVEDRRQSVSGVSLDEEMTDMIRFQHAYNAAARNITVIDEMLDRIINGMGIVGR